MAYPLKGLKLAEGSVRERFHHFLGSRSYSAQMQKHSPIEVPTSSKGDLAHAAAKAALSTIPVIGGPAAELFQHVFQPPLTRRRDLWMRLVGEKLQELEMNGIDMRKLSEDERFVSAVTLATHAALRTHEEKKLLALRNAVINVAMAEELDQTIHHILLNCVDELTVMHLILLNMFMAPKEVPGMSMGGLIDVIRHNIPALREQDELVRLLWRDLYARGLVNSPDLGGTLSGHGLTQRRASRLGEQLLKLIADGTRNPLI